MLVQIATDGRSRGQVVTSGSETAHSGHTMLHGRVTDQACTYAASAPPLEDSFYDVVRWNDARRGGDRAAVAPLAGSSIAADGFIGGLYNSVDEWPTEDNDAEEGVEAAAVREAAGAFGDESTKTECKEFTYGEVLLSSFRELLASAALHAGPDDIFVDLGSGVGITVFVAFVEHGVRHAVGVELAMSRVNSACAALTNLKLSAWWSHHRQHKSLSSSLPSRSIQYLHLDLMKYNLEDASIVTLNNVCFRPLMMLALVRKFQTELRPGSRVIAFKRLPLAASNQKELSGVKMACRLALKHVRGYATTWTHRRKIWVYLCETPSVGDAYTSTSESSAQEGSRNEGGYNLSGQGPGARSTSICRADL